MYYEPTSTPPTASIYQNNDVIENENRNEYEFEGNNPDQTPRQLNNRTDEPTTQFNFLNDPLMRRMSALLSPILPSASMPNHQLLPSHLTSIMKPSNSPAESTAPFYSPFPHPSYRHRHEESPIPQRILNSTGFDERALFLYPREVPTQSSSSSVGGRHQAFENKDCLLPDNRTTSDSIHYPHQQYTAATTTTATATTTEFGNEREENERIIHNNHTERNRPSQESQLNQTQDSYRYDFTNTYPEISSTNHNNNCSSSSTQARLIQKSTGGMALGTSHTQHTTGWAQVGQIGAYHEANPESNETPTTTTTTGSKKKKKRQKKKKKRPQPDIRAMVSPKLSHDGVAHSLQGEEHVEAEVEADGAREDFVVEKQSQRKTNGGAKKGKKRSRDKIQSSDDGNALSATTGPITDDMLREFAEHYDVKNAGANVDSLSTFLRLAKSQGHLTWTIIFHDGSCTTPFLPSTKKYCTEKGPPCTHWNCLCDKQIRAMQASAPLVGVMFVFPIDDESSSLDCFLLPLGPTTDTDEGPSDLDPGYERMAQWPFLPILCETTLQQRWDAFQSILMDKHLVCVTYNAQLGLMPYHYHCTHDIELRNKTDNRTEPYLNLVIPRVFDLRLASWMLAPQSVEKDHEFEKKYEGFPHLWPQVKPPPPNVSEQIQGLIEAKTNLEFLYALYPIVNNILDSNGLKSSFEDIESPVQSILSSMECNGIGFQADRLIKIQGIIKSRIDVLISEARKIAQDDTFLLSSPQQVSQLLFEKMGIRPANLRSAKSATGSKQISTSEEMLKAIQKETTSTTGQGIPIIELILEFRTLSKMLNTYIRPYPQLARPGNSHIRRKRSKKRSKRKADLGAFKMHPMWMQTAVRTGRLSCRKPNMQQIPTGSIYGVSPRDAFTSSCKETCLFAFDYSQNEVRILAHMSGDDALISLFRQPGSSDIYKQMSSITTGKSVDEITDQERAVSKQVTLAIMYGMGLPQVAKKLGVNRSAAKKFFDSFYGRFRGVKIWMDQTKEFARKHKFVKTISGRRRYLDNIVSNDSALKTQAERQAVNSVIQGSAADLMKLAMLKIASRLTDWRKEGSDTGGSGAAPKMLLQIHDELVFEIMANKANVDRLTATVNRCCAEECAEELHLKVPLKLKCSVGTSWGNMKEI